MITKKVDDIVVGDILLRKDDNLYYTVDSIIEDDESGHNLYFKYLGYVRKKGLKKMFTNLFNDIHVYEKSEVSNGVCF